MAANEKTGKTIRAVFGTLNDEQKELLYVLVGKALEKSTDENEEDEEPTMNKIPFCGQCAFYGGRINGIGTCNFGKTIKAEHIKSDFWCIKGIFKNRQT